MSQKIVLQISKAADASAAAVGIVPAWAARFGVVCRLSRVSFIPAADIAPSVDTYAVLSATVNGVAALSLDTSAGGTAGVEMTAAGAVSVPYGAIVGFGLAKANEGPLVPAGMWTIELELD